MADVQKQHGSMASSELWDSGEGLEKNLGRNFEGKTSHRIEDGVELLLKETFVALKLPHYFLF
jgi:hypothetical protein